MVERIVATTGRSAFSGCSTEKSLLISNSISITETRYQQQRQSLPKKTKFCFPTHLPLMISHTSIVPVDY